MDLEISDHTEGRTAVIVLKGDLDDFNADQLMSRFKVIMGDQAPERIVVDLEGLAFLDSVGLGVIAKAAKDMKKNAGHVALVCTKPQVLRLLETSGLVSNTKSSLLHVFESRDRALKTRPK